MPTPSGRATAAEKRAAAGAEEGVTPEEAHELAEQLAGRVPDAPTPEVGQPVNAAEALSFVIRELPSIGKTGTMSAPGSSYKYRELEEITSHVSVLFAKHGLVVTPRIIAWEQEQVGSTKAGNIVMECRVVMEYTFHHGASGTSIVAGSLGIGRDSSDKAGNKAQSAAFKYVLLPSLMIADGKDEQDAERIETSGRRSEPPRPPEQAQEPEDPDLEARRKKALDECGKVREQAGKDSPYTDAIRAEAERVMGPGTGKGSRVPAWCYDHPEDAYEFAHAQYELWSDGQQGGQGQLDVPPPSDNDR